MKRIALIFLVFLNVTACTQAPQIENLSAQEFKNMLESTPEKTLLDVRTDAEVASGMIPGAVQADIQANDLDRKLDSLDKSQPVFVYCAMGSRSSAMASILSQKGFKKIYNAEGGIMAWQAADYPIASEN